MCFLSSFFCLRLRLNRDGRIWGEERRRLIFIPLCLLRWLTDWLAEYFILSLVFYFPHTTANPTELRVQLILLNEGKKWCKKARAKRDQWGKKGSNPFYSIVRNCQLMHAFMLPCSLPAHLPLCLVMSESGVIKGEIFIRLPIFYTAQLNRWKLNQKNCFTRSWLVFEAKTRDANVKNVHEIRESL